MMSINNIAERKVFWDDQHHSQNIATLSNCSLEQVREGLFLNQYLKPGAKVLEVGVGTGRATKELFELGHYLSVVDISSAALVNVAKFCINTFKLDEVTALPSNYFDVIICCNVIQHTPTAVLRIEIQELMRSLGPNGVFAVQFVSCGDREDVGATVGSDRYELGCYGRTSHFMERLFAEFDGVCKIMSFAKVDISPVTASYVFHVTKLNKNV